MDRAQGIRRLLYIVTLLTGAVLIASLAIYLTFHVPTVTPRAWLEYQDRKANGVAPFLTDFSYAGYHYQATPLPHVNGTVFDVTHYGSHPGQGYADDGVQAAIDAAQVAGGGIVYFPAGEYKFGPASGGKMGGNCLRIGTSNIVLRGEGTDKTVLFLDNWLKGDKFLIYAAGEGGKTLATVADSIYRGTAQLKVDKVGRIKPGTCFRLAVDPAPQLLKPWFGDIPMDETWTEIQQGVRVDHPHCIRAVDAANNILTLEEPIHFDLPRTDGVVVSLKAIKPLREIGIEHIHFRSGWANKNEPLCHNCNEMMISGWQAVGLSVVRDAWVKNCVFDSFIQAVRLDTSSAVTVAQNKVVGKMGHHSFRSLRGYGNLFVDNVDTAGTIHGPSVQSTDMGTVFLRHQMEKGQSIDMHGDMATHTLLDSVVGGQLFVSGGKEAVFPNHALELTVWNFRHRADMTLKGTAYRFWPIDLEDERRFGSVYFKPIVVGLYGDKVEIDKTTVYHMDAIGKRANPQSLFEAQVALRLAGGTQYSLPLAPFAANYQTVLAQARVDEALTIRTNYHPKVVYHFFSWRKVKSGLLILAGVSVAMLGLFTSYRLVLRPAWDRRRAARAQEAQLDSYRMLPDDPMT